MRATTKKTLRDLRRQRAQVVAVAVTVMLGVGLFIASAGAFENLHGSYERTYDRLGFADLTATGGDPERLAEASISAGASAATVRTQADAPLLVEGSKLVGRVVGLPAGSRPAVNDVDVVEGRYLSPEDPTGVLLETHAATTFALSPGDTLEVFTGSRWTEATVRGVVVSPEYLWPARSRQEVLGDPHSFAVVFAAEEVARQWGEGPNQVLVDLPDDLRTGDVTAALREAGATHVMPRSEQPSHAALQLDLDGFEEMSIAFPVLFLTAAAMAAYVLLTRRVRAERPVIGTLMAAGARRGPLVRHYLGQGLAIGVLGGIAGVGLGVLATGAITEAYTSELGIPDTVVSQHYGLAAVGLGIGVLVGVLGAAAPAIAAARTAPAEAMRNEVTARAPGRWSRTVSRMRGVPVTVRMALRDVTRSPRRTAATALGALLALVLVLASVGLMTSMTAALELQYDEVERQDATVTAAPGAGDGVEQALRELPAVAAVEPSHLGEVTVSSGGDSYATVLQGFAPDTTMHGFPSDDGGRTAPPGSGVLAGSALGGRLGVGLGDTVTLTAPGGDTTRVRIAGFVEDPLGTKLYATNEVVDTALPGAARSYLVRYDAGADAAELRETISTMPGVVAYSDTDALVRSLDQFLGLFWAFVAVMVLLGVVLALAIIYVTMAVTVVERTNELATMRAAGVRLRRVGGTLATENLVATLLGLPLGLGLGVLAADQFLGLFSSDLFQIPLVMPWWVLLLAGAGVLLSAALSQWPAVRAVRRLDIARVVRERAG